MTAAAPSADSQTLLFADKRKGNMSRMFAAGALSVAVVVAVSIAANAAGAARGPGLSQPHTSLVNAGRSRCVPQVWCRSMTLRALATPFS